MSTAVFFHAHPDDEAIATGGTMAQMAAAGHRVVLVCATRGEQGTPQPDVLAEGEVLWKRREAELAEACRILGVARFEFLGYTDSGMMGEPSNDDPASFWRADQEEAARRLAEILVDEKADVVTVYDADGTYGHPDHIQVHRVGMRAAELAATERVFISTVNRDYLRELFAHAGDLGMEVPDDLRESIDTMGVAASAITTAVDVSGYLGVKQAAMRAHASQIGEDSPFLGLPPEAAAAVWGTEFYVRVGAEPAAELETSLLD
jgi:LmbE family N-acetylglucosaminyl deacetylase